MQNCPHGLECIVVDGCATCPEGGIGNLPGGSDNPCNDEPSNDEPNALGMDAMGYVEPRDNGMCDAYEEEEDGSIADDIVEDIE